MQYHHHSLLLMTSTEDREKNSDRIFPLISHKKNQQNSPFCIHSFILLFRICTQNHIYTHHITLIDEVKFDFSHEMRFFLPIAGARTFPARSFPPDGTTFSQIALGQKLSKQIPPYSYWNMQFYQSEPAYVKFDYNIPRGASIGVYARRNALPTHTQYHFKEVLSGFNARTARSTHVSSIGIKRNIKIFVLPVVGVLF